jgi:hypothetical protein
LYAQDKFIAGDILEDTLRDVFELDTNFHLRFIQSCGMSLANTCMEIFKKLAFSGLENERHTFPTRVMDPKCESSVCRTDGVARNCIIIEVAWLPIRCDILS